MGWLPDRRQSDEPPERPWHPSGVETADPAELAYVVVDEIVGNHVGLVVSSWPKIDNYGRLRFPGGSRSVGASLVPLQTHLDARRQPELLRRRPIRIGDVFAVRVRARRQPEQSEDDPAGWMDEVFDVTGEARQAARTSFFSAVTPRLDPSDERDRHILELAEPDDEVGERQAIGGDG